MLDVVLPARYDKRGNLIAYQIVILSHYLILDAAHALHHLVIQRAGASPSNRRRHDYDIGPDYDSVVNFHHLVLFVHLRYGAGKYACLSILGVIALAVAKGEIAQLYHDRLGAKLVLCIVERELKCRL